MLGGDAEPLERANDFSQYSDAELFAELSPNLGDGKDQAAAV